MQAFLRLLQRVRAPALPVGEFTMEVGGSQSLQVLMRHGIVLRADPATWWCCGGAERSTCPRQIVENPMDRGRPFRAICPASPSGCSSVLLTEHDLERLTTSTEAISALLRHLFGTIPGARLDGSGVLGYKGIPLGTLGPPGRQRDVFLALEPLDSAFLAFVGDRRNARQHSLVLVPSAWRLPMGLLDRHGPADHVEILCLDQVLTIAGDEVVLAMPPDLMSSTAGVDTQPFCRLLDPAGLRPIVAAEYQAILAGGQYGLLLDLTVMTGKGYAAYLRGVEGPIRKRLTRNGGLILGELILTGRPVAEEQLKWTSIDYPLKVFERNRAIIEGREGKPSSRSWRLFHSQRAAGSKSVELVFSPPDGFRYAVLLSLQTPEDK
jgi:hypothetical protein